VSSLPKRAPKELVQTALKHEVSLTVGAVDGILSVSRKIFSGGYAAIAAVAARISRHRVLPRQGNQDHPRA
jgi:hypothetical protein